MKETEQTIFLPRSELKLHLWDPQYMSLINCATLRTGERRQKNIFYSLNVFDIIECF